MHMCVTIVVDEASNKNRNKIKRWRGEKKKYQGCLVRKKEEKVGVGVLSKTTGEMCPCSSRRANKLIR